MRKMIEHTLSGISFVLILIITATFQIIWLPISIIILIVSFATGNFKRLKEAPYFIFMPARIMLGKY